MRAIVIASIVAMTLLGSGGCSVLVDPDDKPLSCDPTATPNPCPDGLVCRGNTCQEPGVLDAGMMDVPRIDGCVPNPAGELCGGGDDDCDGMIDEGHDVDGDGYYWCGDGTSMATVDCDDNDRSVHPGAEELCDSVDNDCDRMIDEDAGLSCARTGDICTNGICRAPDDCRIPTEVCTGGMTCDTTRDPAVCVAIACDDPTCAMTGQVCDRVRGVCVTPVAFGAACGSDAECSSHVCVDRTAAGLTSGAASFCSSACCADTDCPAASICWASGTGAKVCVPEGLLGFTRGTKAGTQSCGSGDECSSGICFTDGCMGNCGRDGDCSGAACQILPYRIDSTVRTATMCDAPTGSEGLNSDCFDFGADNSQCRSNACFRNTTFTAYCTVACRSGADCSGRYGACGYLTNGSFIQVCVEPPGPVGVGGTCTRNDECRDGACIDRACAATCCATSDCGVGFYCKPRQIGTHWEMHCVP